MPAGADAVRPKREASLREQALALLCLCDPDAKASAVQAMQAACAGQAWDAEQAIAEPTGVPGRPAAPCLRPAKEVPTRTPYTVPGRAALLHAIAHIEFNAIDLAWDAVYRFRGLPHGYYADWVGVANDEARHFVMLRDHGRGFFPADHA